jgi:hypothetical protein
LVSHHQGDLGAVGGQLADLRTELESYSKESRLHDTECEVCKRMNADEDSREFFRRLTAGATADGLRRALDVVLDKAPDPATNSNRVLH